MKTCLIVDDSVMVRKVLSRMIEDMGFTCLESDNGEAAYDVCRGKMPDVIVLDWDMPVMDGLEFIQKLRRTAGGDTPKVIFCTSENDSKKIHKAINAGADEYIMKPFDTDIIRSKFTRLNLYNAPVNHAVQRS